MVVTKEQNCKEAEHYGVGREEEVSEQGSTGASKRLRTEKGEAGSGNSGR